MKHLSITLLLLVAACGGGAANQTAANGAENSSHGHDHFHSHEGETIALGKQKLGQGDVSAFLKDKLQRGGTTQFEIQFSDTGIQPADLLVEILDTDDKRIVRAGVHSMSQPGRFGAHAALPADAPKNLKLRVTRAGQPPAEFEIRE